MIRDGRNSDDDSNYYVDAVVGAVGRRKCRRHHRRCHSDRHRRHRHHLGRRHRPHRQQHPLDCCCCSRTPGALSVRRRRGQIRCTPGFLFSLRSTATSYGPFCGNGHKGQIAYEHLATAFGTVVEDHRGHHRHLFACLDLTVVVHKIVVADFAGNGHRRRCPLEMAQNVCSAAG